MSSDLPELGSKISLISKADIRYEGRLYTVDPQECTIALSNVRSFGTEDRETQFQIAPQSQVYDYILFRGSDIKDIRVVNNSLPHPNDPAIMQVQLPNGQHMMPHFQMPNLNAPPPGAYTNPFGGLSLGNMGSNNPVGGPSMAPGSGVPVPFMVGNQQPQPPQQQQQQQQQPVQPKGPTPLQQKQAISVLDMFTNVSRSTTPNLLSRKTPPNDMVMQMSQQQQHQQQQQQQQQQQLQQHNQHHNQNQVQQNQNNAGHGANARDAGHKRQNHQQRSGGAGGTTNNVNNNNNNPRNGSGNNNDFYHQRDRRDSGRNMDNYNQNHDMRNNFNNQRNQGGNSGNGGNGNNGGRNQNNWNMHRSQNNPNMMRNRGGGGRGRMPNQGGFRSMGPLGNQNKPRSFKNAIKFEKEFDFEQANNKFEELRSRIVAQISNLKVGDEPKSEQINGETDKKDDSGNETGAGEHEPEEEEITVGYDKTKSFFDNISCEAAQDRTKNKKNDWRKERKLNSETFGVSSTRRGSYRGRGNNFYNRNAGSFGNGSGGGGGNGYNRGYRTVNNFRIRTNNRMANDNRNAGTRDNSNSNANSKSNNANANSTNNNNNNVTAPTSATTKTATANGSGNGGNNIKSQTQQSQQQQPTTSSTSSSGTATSTTTSAVTAAKGGANALPVQESTTNTTTSSNTTTTTATPTPQVAAVAVGQ